MLGGLTSRGREISVSMQRKGCVRPQRAGTACQQGRGSPTKPSPPVLRRPASRPGELEINVLFNPSSWGMLLWQPEQTVKRWANHLISLSLAFFHAFNSNVNICKNQRLIFRKTIITVSGTHLVLSYYVQVLWLD